VRRGVTRDAPPGRRFRHDGHALLRLDLAVEADREDGLDVQGIDLGELQDRVLEGDGAEFTRLQQHLDHDEG
jgi:hypothetical protein